MSCLARLSFICLASILVCNSAHAQSGRKYCSDFPNYKTAVSYCMEQYGTTLGCGGLDRDMDGLPCECNPGGPEANEKACKNRKEKNS